MKNYIEFHSYILIILVCGCANIVFTAEFFMQIYHIDFLYSVLTSMAINCFLMIGVAGLTKSVVSNQSI